MVKVRVTSVERPRDESGRSRVRYSLASGRRNRSKDRPLQLGVIAQETNTTRADGSHRKRKERNRFEARREQEWLCTGMARGRVTSSVTRCGVATPQLCSIISPGEEIGFVRRELRAIWRFAPGR